MVRVKLRPAEQKMKIWFLLSLGLLSLSARDQKRSGGGCLAESAFDFRRAMFKRRRMSRNPVQSTSIVFGRPAQSSGLKRQVVGAGFCNGFPLDRGTRTHGPQLS